MDNKGSKNVGNQLANLGREFPSMNEAKKFYDTKHFYLTQYIGKINSELDNLNLDYSAESLLRFEALYFEIYVDQTQNSSLKKDQFEDLLTHYLQSILVKEEIAQREIEENIFSAGKYQDGIRFKYGTWTNEDYAAKLDQIENNPDRNYLYSYFKEIAPENK